MAQSKNYIAVDLGAESGRVMLAALDAEKLSLQEIHRFPNGPIQQDGSMRWDFKQLCAAIKTGIGQAARQAGGEVAGIAVDSWGVDFGLIEKLKERVYPTGITLIDNCQQCISRLIDIVTYCSFIVSRS